MNLLNSNAGRAPHAACVALGKCAPVQPSGCRLPSLPEPAKSASSNAELIGGGSHDQHSPPPAPAAPVPAAPSSETKAQEEAIPDVFHTPEPDANIHDQEPLENDDQHMTPEYKPESFSARVTFPAFTFPQGVPEPPLFPNPFLIDEPVSPMPMPMPIPLPMDPTSSPFSAVPQRPCSKHSNGILDFFRERSSAFSSFFDRLHSSIHAFGKREDEALGQKHQDQQQQHQQQQQSPTPSSASQSVVMHHTTGPIGVLRMKIRVQNPLLGEVSGGFSINSDGNIEPALNTIPLSSQAESSSPQQSTEVLPAGFARIRISIPNMNSAVLNNPLLETGNNHQEAKEPRVLPFSMFNPFSVIQSLLGGSDGVDGADASSSSTQGQQHPQQETMDAHMNDAVNTALASASFDGAVANEDHLGPNPTEDESNASLGVDAEIATSTNAGDSSNDDLDAMAIHHVNLEEDLFKELQKEELDGRAAVEVIDELTKLADNANALHAYLGLGGDGAGAGSIAASEDAANALDEHHARLNNHAQDDAINVNLVADVASNGDGTVSAAAATSAPSTTNHKNDPLDVEIASKQFTTDSVTSSAVPATDSSGSATTTVTTASKPPKVREPLYKQAFSSIKEAVKNLFNW